MKLFKEMLDVAVSSPRSASRTSSSGRPTTTSSSWTGSARATSSAPNGKIDAAPVSAWRKMFIANEWNELQSRRVTSRELTLLLMVLFLEGLNYQNLAIIEPSMGTDDPRRTRCPPRS